MAHQPAISVSISFQHPFNRAGGRTSNVLQEMRVLLRALIVIAAIWAILAPATYGLLFGFSFDWSALFDFVVVGSCAVLAFTAFKDISLILWLVAFIVVAVSGASGFFYHFQDSGESGPLPFEWLNNYFLQALPLLLIAAISRLFDPNKEAEQAAS